MKTKLTILTLPFCFLLLIGCSGLVKDLIEDKINKEFLNGNWKVVEFYTTQYEGLTTTDYANVNILGKLITFQTNVDHCPGKMDKTEERLDDLRISFQANGNGTFSQKGHYKYYGLNEKCEPFQDDDSGENSAKMTWSVDLIKAKLKLNGLLDADQVDTFDIDELSSNKLIISQKDQDDVIKLVFRKM